MVFHPVDRQEDLIELWFSAAMELTFRLQDPAGGQSPDCNAASGDVSWKTAAGNLVLIDYELSNSLAGR